MRRPFSLRLLPGVARDMLWVDIEPASPMDAAQVRKLQTMAGQFADFANAGALCGRQYSPQDSGIGLAEARVDGTRIRWTFSDVRISSCSWHLLLNVLHAFHEKVSPIRSVDLSWQDLSQAAKAGIPIFPAIAAPLPFELIYEPDDEVFDIIVDFAEAQDEDRLTAINEVLGHWLCAVDLGAYGDESLAPEVQRVLFDSDEPCTMDSRSLVWSIVRFHSTPNALAGLVNVVSKIHQRLGRVEALTIAE
jgi:hypothetical protein